jgi:hypothetical protein
MFLNDHNDVGIKDRVVRVEYYINQSTSTRRHSTVDGVHTQAHGDEEMTDHTTATTILDWIFKFFWGFSNNFRRVTGQGLQATATRADESKRRDRRLRLKRSGGGRGRKSLHLSPKLLQHTDWQSKKFHEAVALSQLGQARFSPNRTLGRCARAFYLPSLLHAEQ